MKKNLLLTIALALVLSSCGKSISQNPDKDFEKMYWWDTKAALNVEEQAKGEPSSEQSNVSNEENKEKKTLINQSEPPKPGDMIAIMETSKWTIKIKLFPDATPKTYQNFKWLADKWYYNWQIFHRVINKFMIQWWDPSWTWRWWQSIYWTDFEDEPREDLKNIRWALSMANRWPNTNWSQFFIVQAPAVPDLDWYQNWVKTCGQVWVSCHTVFGQVYEWIDVIDTIAWVQTNWMDKPVEDIVIKSVKVEEFK